MRQTAPLAFAAGANVFCRRVLNFGYRAGVAAAMSQLRSNIAQGKDVLLA